MPKADDICELRMKLVRKSDAACLVCGELKGELPGAKPFEIWILRSLMGRTQINGAQEEGKPLPEIVFTLPEWKVYQSNLWEFVTS